MINDIIAIATSGGVGSIVGLAGGILTKFIEYKDRRAQLSFDIQKLKYKLEELQLEQNHELAIADKQVERAKVEGEIQIESIEADAFLESQKRLGSLTGFLRFVRPAITGYLLLAYTAIFAIVWLTIGGISGFERVDLIVLLSSMINSVIFLTTMAVSWWFASRPGNIK
jgi:hypothetical protein